MRHSGITSPKTDPDRLITCATVLLRFRSLDLFPNSPVKCDDVDEKVRLILGDPSHLLRHMTENTRRWLTTVQSTVAQNSTIVSKNVNTEYV